MADRIRTVTVEFLRKGPPHNQLLSPLTEYLGICGGSGAGPVTLPYEQARFNHDLSQLRYPDDDEQEQAPRQLAMRTFGKELGEVLGQVPGLTGILTQLRDTDELCLVNLRLVSSASELSMLPFELSKVPSGAGKPTDEYLALQAGIPVCVTRRFRSVQPCRVCWPLCPPRVLFIVGLDVTDDLAEKHRKNLEAALSPWWSFGEEGEEEKAARDTRKPGAKAKPSEQGETKRTKEEGKRNEDRGLVEIRGRDANVPEITRQLAKGFPYVHILAHGGESAATEGVAYGLVLAGETEDEVDILTGDRFSSILCSLPCEVERPSLIVSASCDSATQAEVLVPGGSFAQYLHRAGIPLVVGSQFPLTTRGSVSLTDALYEGLFWGGHPLEILARARARLHAEDAYSHDWASLVVYDALPKAMELDEVRYQRANAAFQTAQRHKRGLEDTRSRAFAERALGELPTSEAYARECEGLRASFAKQLAKIAYLEGKKAEDAALGARDPELAAAKKKEAKDKYAEARERFVKSRDLYRQAASRFLLPGGDLQRHATLHWVQIQALVMDRVLGDPADPWAWPVAHRSAELELRAKTNKQPYWSHGSLAELCLLKLFELRPNDRRREEVEAEAKEHIEAILKHVDKEAFPIFSTRRQFNRYIELWGDPEFSTRLGLGYPSGYKRRWDGVRGLAHELVRMLS